MFVAFIALGVERDPLGPADGDAMSRNSKVHLDRKGSSPKRRRDNFNGPFLLEVC